MINNGSFCSIFIGFLFMNLDYLTNWKLLLWTDGIRTVSRNFKHSVCFHSFQRILIRNNSNIFDRMLFYDKFSMFFMKLCLNKSYVSSITEINWINTLWSIALICNQKKTNRKYLLRVLWSKKINCIFHEMYLI
jgi:hypothetical protein